MIDIEKVRQQFPFFINNPELVYLDSAATAHKPQRVIDVITEFYATENSNAGRASYALASKLDKRVAAARLAVAKFVGAKADEIFFTAGATDSFNKVAFMLGMNLLEDGDEVLYSPLDHSSFVQPWFAVKDILSRMGVNIKLVAYRTKETGGADMDDLREKITSKTKVVNITHIHNVFGSNSDIEKLKVGDNRNFIVNVDATQSVGHMPVNVSDLGADILSFSGHKMFAAQGTGVTYISKKLHSTLKPIFSGGGGTGSSDFDQQNFEVGTQNYAGLLSLQKAIEFIEEIGIENIENHVGYLTTQLLQKLRQFPQIEFLYGPNFWTCAGGYGIISFNVRDIPSGDIGFALSQKGILVRTGSHCSTTNNNLTDSVRVSMHAYNTEKDIGLLVEALSGILT